MKDGTVFRFRGVTYRAVVWSANGLDSCARCEKCAARVHGHCWLMPKCRGYARCRSIYYVEEAPGVGGPDK